MSSNLSGILRNALKRDAVVSTARSYERVYGSDEAGNLEQRKTAYKDLTNKYYDLVKDFYEYGWGDSFHFAPRASNESFPESLVRHERYLARRLALRPGMRVADLGCGVGGPLREVARVSGATIVGVNNNEYQLDRARKLTDEAGLGHLAEFLKCDFMHMDAPDESFDAAFSIESTVHAPTKVDCYGEVFRVLKPGGCFAAYEYCLTSRFDPNNPRHQKIKTDLEIGAALPDIAFPTKSTTHCGRSDSSCWKAETWLRKRGQAFPGTSPSPVRDSPLPAFAVRQRDAWRRMARCNSWKRSASCPREPCVCPDS